MYRILPVLACLTILGACGSRDDELGSSDTNEMVVTHELSLDREHTISISVIDTIGDISNDQELFGMIGDVDVYGDRIYVLDSRLPSITLYDRSTRRQLERIPLPEGEGPGEMYGPAQFCMDSDGYYYIATIDDKQIHIFDDEFTFQKRKQIYTIATFLHASDSEVIILPQYVSKTAKSVAEVINQKGKVIATFGEQHEDFAENWVQNRLQLTHFTWITSDIDHIYIATALPFEIQAFTPETHNLVAKYSFKPTYAGGQVESQSGSFMYPTGVILGLNSFQNGELIVFARDNKADITYLYLLNTKDLTYIECSLTELLGNAPTWIIATVAGDMLYLVQEEPFPYVLAMNIEVTNN